MAVIEAYVTNLGKYNEGELASALLKFPTTREAVQEVLKQIGIDNIRYEEIFIADYDGDLSELNACLGEYESIDELNHLACLLSELDKSDLEKFEAVVASGEHTSGAGDLINLAENLDCYDFYIGVSDDETLGRIYAEDMELPSMPSMTEPSLSVWCRKRSPASRPQRSGNSGHVLPQQSREFPSWKSCSAKSMRTTF